MSSFDDDSLGMPEAVAEPIDGAAPLSDEPIEVPSSVEPAEGAPRRFRVTRGRVLLGVAALIAVFAVIASFISLPYYALTPGVATNVAGLIQVPSSLAHNHTGSVSLVDVEETPVRLIDYLYFELDPNASIISSAAIQGPETNAQFYTEGVLDMRDAQQAATIVALRALGYPVTVTPNGALLYALDPGSPANSVLIVGDVITGVGPSVVTNPLQLGSALAKFGPGAAVSLSVRPYPKGAVKKVSLNLGEWRIQGTGANSQLRCVATNVKTSFPPALLVLTNGQISLPAKGQTGHPVACLGALDAEASYAISKLPFQVNLNSEGIVGPSAGLAFTLGLIQKLDAADMTGGLKIAATGTISITGQVGAIGGIKQKTIAVKAAGAKIFFVPPDNYADAKKYAGSDLKVYSVSTITQALDILKQNGGRIQKPSASP